MNATAFYEWLGGVLAHIRAKHGKSVEAIIEFRNDECYVHYESKEGITETYHYEWS